MRITPHEVAVIVEMISFYLKSNAELRLFGSRADDDAKGGDIDLLLIIESNREKSKIFVYKSDILSTIKEKIGDQKIDLLIRSRDEIENDFFVNTILRDSICLKKWRFSLG